MDQLFVSPNGEYLFTKTSYPQFIATWHVPTRQLLATNRWPRKYPAALAFWPDGRQFAAGGDGNTITLWDTHTLRQAGELPGHPDIVRHLAISPDGRTLVSEGRERALRFWNVATGRQLLNVPQRERSDQLAFSADGAWLGSVLRDGELVLWHAPPLAECDREP